MAIDLYIILAQALFLKMEKRPLPRETAVFRDKDSFIKSLPWHYNAEIQDGQPRLQTVAPYPSDPARDSAVYPARDPSCWGVSYDKSEEDYKDPWGWPVLFRSPPFLFALGSPWREAFKKHWDTVPKFAEPRLRSNSLYICPAETTADWTPRQLIHIIQALFYFLKPFEIILDPNSHVSSSNLENPDFQDCCKSLQACFDTDGDNNFKIDRLISIIHPKYVNRDYGWSFKKANKIIGFCFPPTGETAKDSLMWMELAASFVQTAVQYGTLDFLMKECKPSIEGLRHFIRRTEVKGVNDSYFLDMVFKRYSGSA